MRWPGVWDGIKARVSKFLERGVARLFNAYVIVDWSAASKPNTGADSVWIGVLKRDVRFRLAFEAFNPPTRVEAQTKLTAILDDLKKKGVIDKGMRPKVASAVRALEEGVQRVHFIDGRLAHSLLLEIFTDKGSGTELLQG